MKQLSTPNHTVPRRLRHAAICVAALVAPLAAVAQEAVDLPRYSDDPSATESREVDGFKPALQELDFIQFSAGSAGQRPRASLRLRFDAATRAMRGLGVDADDCRTVLRSSTHRAASSEPRRLGLTVALNCRFF